MSSRRNSNADRLNEQDGAHSGRPPARDSLSAIAPLLRVRPELQEVCRFASQWKAVHEAESPGWAQFHIVTKGSCRLELQGGKCFELEAGNLLLLPHGDAHVVRSVRGGRSPEAQVRIESNNAIRIKTNTHGESDTELSAAVCASKRFPVAWSSPRCPRPSCSAWTRSTCWAA